MPLREEILYAFNKKRKYAVQREKMPKKEEPQKGNRKKTLRRYVARKVENNY